MVEGKAGSSRKRGRPPIEKTDEVLERRRLSRQRLNARRSKAAVECEGSNQNSAPNCVPAVNSANSTGEPAFDPVRKRGRPTVNVSDEVLEQRKLSRQRVNASRSKREGPSRKRGRPRIYNTEELKERRRLSMQRFNARRKTREPSHTGTPSAPNPVITTPLSLGDVAGEPSRTSTLSALIPNIPTRPSPGEGTPRKRGRPRLTLRQPALEQHTLPSHEHTQCPRKIASASHEKSLSELPPTTNNTVEVLPEGATKNASKLKDVPGPTNVGGGRINGESQRMRKSIDMKKKLFLESDIVLDLGRQEETCGFCAAQVWAAEFTGRHVPNGPKGYSICCGKGKVQLPLLREAPPELNELLTSTGTRSTLFFNKSRIYNNLFAFCSFGGNVDHSVNNGNGPYVFRVSGRTYHSFGSLIPPDGLTPKFAQLYMYDAGESLAYRVNFPGKMGQVDPEVVAMLQEMMNRENVLVGIFKQLNERYRDVDLGDVRLRLLERRASDGRFENMLTENDYEFAGLAVDNNFANTRDIVADSKINGLQHISELHPSFMSLQYPLLFPFGEDGYRTNIKHRHVTDLEGQRYNTVSMREYYSFRTHYRLDEGHALLLGGRLFLQFLVDAWCSVERVRLRWVYRHQSVIRSDLYNNIVDCVRRGDVDATEVGKRVILPSSFTGGYRYMQQNFQDSLAVCKEYGHPDLFITFTCNPKWPEIQSAVESSGSRDASVRPDLVARVFKMRLDAMIDDFTKKSVLGRVIAVVYTVEFQKRGLPHAHIVLWLAPGDKLTTPEDIDNVICAEIPDNIADPVGYQAVSQFMMHGPCGEANPKCPCMFKGKCSKYYPRAFSNTTTFDGDGYALYRRRDTKRTVECKKIHLDNRHVVPYHRGLLVKYQGHINVEWCNRSLSIKYLFKYIGKGPDTATIILEKSDQQLPNTELASTSLKMKGLDEVNNYLSCRYVSSAEACWRLFEFPIHHREPYVQRLYFHLENEQEIRFRDNERLPEVVRRVDPDGTMFIQWLLINCSDELGRDLTFVKFPTKFKWDASARQWFRRKQNIDVVGRMVYAHPASGERFYMRLLLNIVVGPKSFEDIRTVDGVVYPTYKEACFHRGLLESDNEWHIALEDAALCANASQLRDLFVTLLVFCEVSNPLELWDRHWVNLSDDIKYTRRKLTNMPTLRIDNNDKQMLALEAISQLLRQYGKKLCDYPGLPTLNVVSTSKFRNELLLEEMMYDREQLRLKADHGVQCLNQMQRLIFDQIIESVELDTGGFYFIYGSGGTGKTFLWSTIISKLRSEGKIVLAVASSGIAALLIDGGRTAHSRFKIPIDINEFSCCEIKQNTYLAELLCNTSLVIWDEAPMTHRFVFEAVDRTFRDIRSKVNKDAHSLPFGGLPMILGGDFRQILPVIPKKGRPEIVSSSISKSQLWSHCKVFNLCENMRLEKNVPPVTIDGKKVPFRDWILALGDGLEETFAFGDEIEPTWIKLPEEVRVDYSGDPVDAVVKEVYMDLQSHHGDIEYLRDRAILTPLNEDVEVANNNVLERLPGEFRAYSSCDSICKGSSTRETDEVLYPPEYLNSLKFSGMPNHEIRVKVGAPIMLLRNLNPRKGLCNGTRLVVKRCYPFLIEGLIITGSKIGDTTYIPRITMSPADKTLPFLLKRKQFPVAVCYAMTVNKSQGQTVKNVGLYLPRPVFGHGQIYVAVSRVTSPDGLKIVCVNENEACAGYTQNIVYREIFDDIM